MRCFVRWNRAATDWLGGRLGPAERGLAEALAERRAALEFFAGFLPMRVCYDLGEVQRARGNLDGALATYRQALDEAVESSQVAFTGLAHVGLAQVLYEQNELTAALDHATRGVTLCRQLAVTWPLAIGLATLARIRQAQGDAAAALEVMGEAGHVELSPQVIALFNPVPSQRARLLLAQGDAHAAAQWTAAAGLSPDDEPDYPREPAYLVLVRVLLAQHEPGPALRLLRARTSRGRCGGGPSGGGAGCVGRGVLLADARSRPEVEGRQVRAHPGQHQERPRSELLAGGEPAIADQPGRRHGRRQRGDR
jgi:LuxR family maltose regulon positive regulatory protein